MVDKTKWSVRKSKYLDIYETTTKKEQQRILMNYRMFDINKNMNFAFLLLMSRKVFAMGESSEVINAILLKKI